MDRGLCVYVYKEFPYMDTHLKDPISMYMEVYGTVNDGLTKYFTKVCKREDGRS